MCKQKLAWRLQRKAVSFTGIVTCLSDCSYYECSLLFKFDFSSPAVQGRLVGHALVLSEAALSQSLGHSGKKGDMTARGTHTMLCGKSSVWHPWGGLYLPRLLGRNKLLTFFLKVPNRLYCRASDAGENEMGTEEHWVSSMPQVLTKPRRWCGHLDYSTRWRRKRRTSGHVITVVMWSSVAIGEGELRSWCILTYLQLRSTTKDDELSSDLKTEEVVHFDVFWSIFSLFFALGWCVVLGIALYNKATVWTADDEFIKLKNITLSITRVNDK